MSKTKNGGELTISQKIEKLCRSKYSSGPKAVFDDVIQLAFNLLTVPAIVQGAFPRTKTAADSALLNEVRRYEKDAEAWALLQDIVLDFIKLIAESDPFTDVIGELYDEYLGKVLGQFLTPSDVATGVAAIHLSIMPKPDRRMRIGDPCGCGAGSMVLALLRQIHQVHGPDALKLMEVIATDLDPHMVRLCTVQVVMSAITHRLPLAAYAAHCCNSLTDQSPFLNHPGTLAYVWEPLLPFEEFYEDELQAMKQITEKFKEMEPAL